MKVRVQVLIEAAEGEETSAIDVAVIERDALTQETLGMTLAEAKQILAGVQKAMVTEQAKAHVSQRQCCEHCGQTQWFKDRRDIVVRTVFGKLKVSSPRFIRCDCQPQKTCTFSPLAELLTERSTPELVYLETKFASLVSYGATVDLMTSLLPLEDELAVSSLHRQVSRVAERMEKALGTEKVFFADGCRAEWNQLPEAGDRLFVSLDGGYVRARTKTQRQAGTMEIITGQCVKNDGGSRRFASVQGYDKKPKRRIFDVLTAQGMQFNQDITFLTDGGDTVRNLTEYLNPNAEHVLDWFHVTMRLTQMGQTAKGLPDGADYFPPSEVARRLDSIKWKLWHGDADGAIERAKDLEFEFEHDVYYDADGGEKPSAVVRKFLKLLGEFITYINLNRAYIPNYGDRYRHGELISSAVAESTVNQVIAKRMCKQQQMRWTQAGAHRLLQLRVRVLDGELFNTFKGWYPALKDQTG